MNTPLPDPEALLDNLYAQILPRITAETAMVGIYTGGVWLLERLLPRLTAAVGHDIPTGKLDAAMYRDDYAQRGLKTNALPASIPFDVSGKHIILVDDIFYTGRTTRAVMNELFDYGRPASIQLAALINRGGAQLPIKPDMVGADLPLAPQQSFELAMNTQGRLNLRITEATSGGIEYV